MSRMTKTSSIIGTVVIVATILVFILAQPIIFPGTALGYLFLLYSEIIFFGGVILIDSWSATSSGIMMGAGVGTIIGGYSIVVFISSIIYMNLHSILYQGFLVFQILLAVFAIAIGLPVAAAAKSRKIKDTKILNADAMVRGFVDELVLIGEKTDKKATINKLMESMKYTDTSIMVDADVEIDEAISELKNIVMSEKYDEQGFNKIVEKMELLIKKRNLQTRNVKQGDI